MKGVKTDRCKQQTNPKRLAVTGFGDVFDGGGEEEEVKK